MTKIKKTSVIWLAVIQTFNRDLSTVWWESFQLAKNLQIPPQQGNFRLVDFPLNFSCYNPPKTSFSDVQYLQNVVSHYPIKGRPW